MAKITSAKKSTAPAAPSRASRVAGKVSFRENKVKLASLSATVTLSRKDQVVEIPCFITSIDEDNIVVRQKARHGSSKQIVQAYPMSSVAAYTNALGFGVVHVLATAPVLVLKDQSVSYEGIFVVATDNKSGEVTRLNTTVGHVSVVVDDEGLEKSVNSSKSAPAQVKRTGTRLKKVVDNDQDFE